MSYFTKTWRLFDNYILARWQHRPSTAAFWYLPEHSAIQSSHDLLNYQQANASPFYLMDYRHKLNYTLENKDGLIVLPYDHPIGHQINPEAAFQYALGLHDQYQLTHQSIHIKKFWQYAHYFLDIQTQDGCWGYQFDWYGSKAPWYSALAQSRGASVMLRAFLLSDNQAYLEAAKKALSLFTIDTKEGGFLHLFQPAQCPYFEEYPQTPTAVLNGFMASLMSMWELNYWLKEKWIENLWLQGLHSLKNMLPYYSNGWWSLYDLDDHTPIQNVNSPRYHLLEINYLKILSIISGEEVLKKEYENRMKQYHQIFLKMKAISLKCVRKIIYK